MRKGSFFVCLFVCIFSSLSANAPEPNQTVAIPMRDGTKLSADIYFPKEHSVEPLPCVLIRSPAGRGASSCTCLSYLVEHGYVVAIQDTRSAADSSGSTFPYKSDGWGDLQDGYDTVEWLAKSDFCNGKVGTIGYSAAGITQMLLAPSQPPSLKCQYINVAASSLYDHAVFHGGKLVKSQVEGWLGMYANAPSIREYIAGQPRYNEFWQTLDSNQVAHKVTVPAVHHGGWFDIFLQGTIEGFHARQKQGGEGAKGKQKLVIGPWSHFWPHAQALGDFEVPSKGRTLPHDLSMESWLSHHLKGVGNVVDTTPAVTYYVMGPFDGSSSSGNVWRTADHWPIPHTPTALYLHPSKRLESSSPRQQVQVSYKYDPARPIPTLGGRNLFLESGPKDQREIEQREDIVLFTSEVLSEDIEVTGKIAAKLFISSNQKSTDVVVRLCDVYPDGRSVLIADGIKHVSDATTSKENPLEIEVDLWSTSLVFAKGHRIRVSVSSSSYPKFATIDPHDATTPSTLPCNQIFLGEEHPSCVILPLVRKGELSTSQKLASIP